MSRRTNLNTVRRSFLWNSDWMVGDDIIYHKLLLIDYKINEYLIGLFYALKMPTSNYIIRRFLDNFVLIETDIYFFDTNRLLGFLKLKQYFYYSLFTFKKHLFRVSRRKRFATNETVYSCNQYLYHFLRNKSFITPTARYLVCFLPTWQSYTLGNSASRRILLLLLQILTRMRTNITIKRNLFSIRNKLRYLKQLLLTHNYY
jgi:hypothetical protein